MNPRVKGETAVRANGLTQHQRGEAGMGEEGGRDWEGDARQTCRASYWVRLQITGGGPLQGGEEGLRVVSHLHSPIKFLYF